MTRLVRSSFLLAVALLAVAGSEAVANRGASVISPSREGNAMVPRVSPDGSRISYEVNYPAQRHTELFIYDLGSGSETKVSPGVSTSNIASAFGAGARHVTQEMAWGPSGLYAFASSGSNDNFDVYLSGVSVPIGGNQKEGAPAISPDGRHLAYCSGVGGDGSLYLMDLHRVEDGGKRITDHRGGFEFYPSWAPDSTRMAFVRLTDEGDNIYVVDDITGTPQVSQLTRWPSAQLKPTFSPAGDLIAFYSNHDNPEATTFDLYVVEPRSGATPRRVAQRVVPNERYGPAWSPDGAFLFYVADDKNAGDPIYAVAKDGSGARPVATGTVNNSDPAVGASGDGWVLSFVAQGEQGQDQNTWKRVFRYELRAGDPR